uniref:Uncharacterized protein n=1 Tax=Proboscia inermis TaxID=420281 RepID=A0A7S0GJD3_9STRA
MKLTTAAIFFIVGSASAGGTPEVSITLKQGTYDNVKSALAPQISFEGDIQGVEYGASMDVTKPGVPSLWGQIKSEVSGWNVKTRAQYSEGEYDYSTGKGAYVTVEGTNEEDDTFVWGSGTVSTDGASPLKVGAKKIFDTENGKFMVAPRFAFKEEKATVVLGYEKDDTKVFVTATQDDQDVKISHKIDDDNTASIKAGRKGFISAALENESEFGTAKVTVTSDDVDIELKKDGWVAGVTASSLDSEPDVRFSKKIAFSANI